MTFSTRLKEARTEAKLTQAELARRVGFANQSGIGNIERGGRVGSTSIAKIAAILGVQPLWLETGRGAKFATTTEPAPETSPPPQGDQHPLLVIFNQLGPIRQAKIMALAYALLVEEHDPGAGESNKRDNFEAKSEVSYRNFDRPRKGKGGSLSPVAIERLTGQGDKGGH